MVEIPDDVAKDIAAWIRCGGSTTPKTLKRWADLLSAKPQTLRDRVADAVAKAATGGAGLAVPQGGDYAVTDAALAVVKADLDALTRGNGLAAERYLLRDDIDALFAGDAS